MENQVRPWYGYVYAGVFGLLLSACTKIEPDNLNVGRPVVEGYLAASHLISVKVTDEALFSLTDTSQAITGLQLILNDGLNSYALTEGETGIYSSPSAIASEGTLYEIAFNYNSKSITASTSIPPKPQNFVTTDTVMVIVPFNSSTGGFPDLPDPITLTWSNPDNSYYLVVVKNIETNPTLINYAETDRVFIFRSNPIQSNTFQIRSLDFRYFGRHWVILYKINSEYAALYQDNGNTSLNIKTPYTNVANGLGIFTGINADTIQVRVKE